MATNSDSEYTAHSTPAPGATAHSPAATVPARAPASSEITA